MSGYVEILIAFHLVVGAIFVLVGSFGLLKLPTLMSRLHGPSKATTLGVGGCLVASMLYFGIPEGRLSVQELLITFFLFITAPVTAHFVAKTHLHLTEGSESELPPPDDSAGWGTFHPSTDAATERLGTDAGGSERSGDARDNRRRVK